MPSNQPKWWVNSAIGSAGMQQATPAIDRAMLERALEFWRGRENEGPYTKALMAAARLHLATLPKPEPMFRVVAVLADGCGRFVSPNGLRATALNLASECIRTGNYNSVAVEQVSP